MSFEMIDPSELGDQQPDTYISFAIPGRFLGAVVVAEPDFNAAVQRVIELGLYPGGEAACFWVLPNAYPHNRLLTREDLPNATMVKDLGDEEREVVEANCVKVCGSCIGRQVQ